MTRKALMLVVAALVVSPSAQMPECNILFTSGESSADGGAYIFNTQTSTLTKVWPLPPVGNRGTYAAQFSPDGRRLAVVHNNRFVVMGNDGSAPRTVSSVTVRIREWPSFAWCDAGIFWMDLDLSTMRAHFSRYNPDTDELTTYPDYQTVEGSQFAGLFASTDGSRMFSWLTLSGGKPYIEFANGNFSTPITHTVKQHGHGNAMRPDGRYVLQIGWDFDAPEHPETLHNPHPFLWTVDLTTFTRGPTYTHLLADDMDGPWGKNLVALANSSEWICLTTGRPEYYLWKYETQAPVRVNLAARGGSWDTQLLINHGWMGALPSAGTTGWSITESSLHLGESVLSGALHITGWTDAGSPTVSSSKAWTGTPQIVRNGSTVTLTFTVGNPPPGLDTAVITVRDAAQVTRTSRILWTATPAQRLVIHTSTTDATVTLSWTNTLGSQYTFRVQKQSGSVWGAMQTATTSYTDNDPVNGTNTYRVAAIAGTDTSYQVVSVDFHAPSSVTITYPANGQVFAPGQTITMTWTKVNVPSVVVSMSTDGGETFTMLDNEGQTGSAYPVTLPSEALSVVVLKIHMYQTEPVNSTVTVATTGSAVRTGPAHMRARCARQVAGYDLTGRRLRAVPGRVQLMLSASGTTATPTVILPR